MWIEAQLTGRELGSVIESLLPATIRLDEDKGANRWIRLEPATAVELVPGRGLRIVSSAELCWATALGTVPMRMRELRVLLVPRAEVEDSRPVIAFRLEIETSEFANVPALVDLGIAALVDGALASRPLLWNVSSTFSRSFPLTSRVEPSRTVVSSVRDVRVEVREDVFVLAVLVNVDLTSSR